MQSFLPRRWRHFFLRNTCISTRLYGVELCKTVVIIFIRVRVWNFWPLHSVSRTIFPSARNCSLSVEQMLVFVANLLFRTVTWGVSRSCLSLLHLHFVHHQYLVFIKESNHIVRGSSDTPPCSYEYVCSHWGFHVWNVNVYVRMKETN
jgi:hypothetical protein